MSDSGNHPPLEVLAAYIDGMLSEEETARVAEHISGCEDCFFVYSETVRFQLEHPDEAADPEPDHGEVVPFPIRTEETRRESPRRQRPAAAAALAAAAVLAIAVGVLVYRNLPPQDMPQVTTAELVEPVQGAPGVQNRLYPYRVPRGGGGAQEESESLQQSFIIGSAFVDLRLSLQADNAETSGPLLHRIGKGIKEIDIYPDLGLDLMRRSQNLSSSADLQKLLEETAQWETQIRADDETWGVDPSYFSFGQWTEAGRLAADLQKEKFFRDRKNRRVLSYILASEEIKPSDEVAADLREIEAIWDKDDLQPHDFEALEDKFESILRAYDIIS